MLLPNILKEKGLFGRLALLQMESVAALTSDLFRLLDQADKHAHAANADGQAVSQLALDRLAQALQVAMASGALLCSRGTNQISTLLPCRYKIHPGSIAGCKGIGLSHF